VGADTLEPLDEGLPVLDTRDRTAPPSRHARLLDHEELLAWRGLLRAHARLTKELDVELVSAHGIQLTSYEVLLFLADSPDGRLRMSELADSVLLSRSGLTRLVDRLERQGLLRRESCEKDGRGAYAVITPRGRSLFDRARVTHLDGVRKRFLSRLSRAELRHLGDVWRRTGEH
jgi:DNA-binding MarR family transcriptional regulator